MSARLLMKKNLRNGFLEMNYPFDPNYSALIR